MKISDMIAELEQVKAREGDIECTCTHSSIREDPDDLMPDTFETTADHLIPHDHPRLGRVVRFCL